jgi:hypothetical protein
MRDVEATWKKACVQMYACTLLYLAFARLRDRGGGPLSMAVGIGMIKMHTLCPQRTLKANDQFPLGLYKIALQRQKIDLKKKIYQPLLAIFIS